MISLSFLLPIALAGLAALAIPLFLHLHRRRQRPQTIPFAALRWLGEPQRPQRRVQIQDPWLLLVRCLLVAAVMLALAQPLLGGMAPSTAWQVVWPGADASAIAWQDEDAPSERRWLARGLPPVDSPLIVPENAATESTASLLRELDTQLPSTTPLTIFVPPQIGGLDGARLALGREVTWTIVPGIATEAQAHVGAASAASFSSETSDPLEALAAEAAPTPGRSDCGEIDRAAVCASPPDLQFPRIAIAGVPDGHRGLRYLQAAHAAWASTAGTAATALPELAAGVAPDDSIDVLLWLAPTPLPPPLRDWLMRGGRIVAIGHAADDVVSDAKPADDAATAIDAAHAAMDDSAADTDAAGVLSWRGRKGASLRSLRVERGVLRTLDCPLDPLCLPELLDADFPTILLDWLTPVAAAPRRADAAAMTPSRIERTAPEPTRPLAPLLVMLVALLFVLERWLANGRRSR